MTTKNKTVIQALGELEVLDLKEVTKDDPLKEDDVTVKSFAAGGSAEYKVLSDDISDEDVELLIKAEQLKSLRSIQRMLKFFTILTVVSLVVSFIALVSR